MWGQHRWEVGGHVNIGLAWVRPQPCRREPVPWYFPLRGASQGGWGTPGHGPRCGWEATLWLGGDVTMTSTEWVNDTRLCSLCWGTSINDKLRDHYFSTCVRVPTYWLNARSSGWKHRHKKLWPSSKAILGASHLNLKVEFPSYFMRFTSSHQVDWGAEQLTNASLIEPIVAKWDPVILGDSNCLLILASDDGECR